MSLDNKLCFKIYSASRMLIRLYKPILDKIELTFPQYVVMLALWEGDNIVFKELGKKLMMETGTLTPIIQKLEKSGYVKRNRDTVDERKVYISLTEQGRSLEGQAENVPNEILGSIGITNDEYNQFMQDTAKLFEVLNNAENRY